MQAFDFQVRDDDGARLVAVRYLENDASVWSELRKIAPAVDAERRRRARPRDGVRFVVTDDTGRIVVGMGLKTAVASGLLATS